MSLSEHGTTLTATVGITLDGRHTVKETVVSLRGTVAQHLLQLIDKILIGLVRTDTDDHMGLAKDVSGGFIRVKVMIANIALPTAPVDVTTAATHDVGCGAGFEVLRVKSVVDAAQCAGSIDVLADGTAEQGDIGATVDIAAPCLSILAKATAIGIVHHFSALADDDVGVVLIGLGFTVIHLCRPYQLCIAQVGLGIVKVAGTGSTEHEVRRIQPAT